MSSGSGFLDRHCPRRKVRDLRALDGKFLLAQGFIGAYPAATIVYFQFVFAAITLILIAGALLGRMNFKAG